MTAPPEPIRGRRVTLRPFREDELDLWHAATQALGTGGFPAGPPTREALRLRITRSSSMWNAHELDLAIEVDGSVVGDVQTQVPHPLPPGVFQVGIGLFTAEDRGKGHGTEALSLLVDWLFGTRGARSIQGGTLPSNTAMRAVFDRLGFVEREPILVFGERHLLYVIERDEWSRRGED